MNTHIQLQLECVIKQMSQNMALLWDIELCGLLHNGLASTRLYGATPQKTSTLFHLQLDLGFVHYSYSQGLDSLQWRQWRRSLSRLKSSVQFIRAPKDRKEMSLTKIKTNPCPVLQPPSTGDDEEVESKENISKCKPWKNSNFQNYLLTK